ncbi:mediator of RNA polymerase II transcription subunit 18 [Saccoglossus kowalevskii]|uniref:Mediator of RNA polymerase II transcription subunit 18 n=1 Tax=Saccoglossus kowalevskii TaxID=10224 RepID=A0ABM0GGV7_SACKO|nr:mediator of RNA polymerase II transcription subunit 18 [Saccoglossus kowalevskii]
MAIPVNPLSQSTMSSPSMQEYLLQGSILDSALESLLHRLRGLCDNVEGPETFHDHEMVYILRGTPSPAILRARHALDHPNIPWQLRYVGQSEVGDKNRSTLVRSCIDCATSDNLSSFLVEMGFRLDHEYVIKGYLFRKGRMKITVSKLFRVISPGVTEEIEAVSLSHLVELSVVAPAGQDAVGDDMRSFAEHLKPIVQMEKMDPKRL